MGITLGMDVVQETIRHTPDGRQRRADECIGSVFLDVVRIAVRMDKTQVRTHAREIVGCISLGKGEVDKSTHVVLGRAG